MEDFESLKQENEKLKSQNERLLNIIKKTREDLDRETAVLTSLKNEARRLDVQLNSLKTENEELKNKFAKIENNPIGGLALKVYRTLREAKRRYLS